MAKVFIDGREGTTGLRIWERLSGREDVELLLLSEALRKDAGERRRMINSADVVFLCLPDAAAVEAVSMVEREGVIVIDASSAHRTLPGWAYGLPELSGAHRAAVAASGRIAVPGCHASGFNALVYPLVAGGLMPNTYPVVCHSVTGYSGGGKRMIAQYEDENRDGELDSPRQYGLGQAHKHLPEMKSVSGLRYDPIFTPIVADFYCGMVVTVPIFPRLLTRGADVAQIRALFADHYAGQTMIRVAGEQEPAFLGANHLAGKDVMEIAVSGNDERVVLTARFDNLGKGASGAAVQCMNIALGLDEALHLAQ